MLKKIFSLFLLLVLVKLPVISQEIKDVEVTIYNQDLGVVKEKRELNLKKGIQEIRISDVAALIDPTSVHFKSVSYPNECSILEQNFEYDLISQQKLLEKYLGKEIEIRDYLQEKEGTKEIIRKGMLLSAGDGMVVKIDDKIFLNPPGIVILPDLPEGLIIKPTLSWLISNNKEGKHLTEISYLTSGINWLSDYVLVVDKLDKNIDLTGWVTLDNRSGATYKDAKLKLIAGDVHRITQPGVMRKGDVKKAMMASESREEQFVEKEFFEYHLYTLQRRTTVKDREKKQIEFVGSANIPVNKLFIYDGAKFNWKQPQSYADDLYGERCNKKVWVILDFKNSKENNLGIPLPKGKMRVYKKDDEESLQFIGEDLIDHTPKDENIKIYLGNAFDIVGERKLVDRKVTERSTTITTEIKIKNRKKEDIEVIVVENQCWSNWKITETPHKYEEKGAQTVEFKVKVAKDSEETITYTSRCWW